MNEFTILQQIMRHIDDAKTYHSFAMLCNKTATLARQERDERAMQFRERLGYYSHCLPNGEAHYYHSFRYGYDATDNYMFYFGEKQIPRRAIGGFVFILKNGNLIIRLGDSQQEINLILVDTRDNFIVDVVRRG